MLLFSYSYFVPITMRLQKLSKQQIKESLEMTPAHVVLAGKRKLTHKQKAFAKNIVEGMTQTEAYEDAYEWNGKRKTMSDEASRLAKDPRITAEVEALERAKQFSELYSSAQLRTLVISQLTKEAVDPKSKASERIQALGKLGQVAELGVFVQRTETKIIKDSESAKHELMEQLKKALGDQMRTIDSEQDTDELELLAEITAPAKRNAQPATPPEGDPHLGEKSGSLLLHSNPHNRSPSESNPEKTSFQASNQGQLATLPDKNGNEEGEGGTKNSMCAPSTDTEEAPPLNAVEKG